MLDVHHWVVCCCELGIVVAVVVDVVVVLCLARMFVCVCVCDVVIGGGGLMLGHVVPRLSRSMVRSTPPWPYVLLCTAAILSRLSVSDGAHLGVAAFGGACTFFPAASVSNANSRAGYCCSVYGSETSLHVSVHSCVPFVTVCNVLSREYRSATMLSTPGICSTSKLNC